MKEQEIQMLVLKGIVADMSCEDRAKIDAAKAEVQALLERHGGHGCIAATMVLLDASVSNKVGEIIAKMGPNK